MAQASLRQSARITERDPRYLFTVAQIFNLPYRRFVIGRTLLAGGRWQVKNLRYSRLPVCATGAAGTLNAYERLRYVSQLQNCGMLRKFLNGERRTRIRSTCRPPCTTSGNICNVNFSPRCWTNCAVWENGISTLSKSSVFCLWVRFCLATAGRA